MEYGSCSPTDIDAALEFGGKVLILYELKYGTAKIQRGQMLLLTRIVDSWDGDSALFICRHNTPTGTDVLLKDCEVTEVYYKGKLKKPKERKTADELTKDFLKYEGIR